MKHKVRHSHGFTLIELIIAGTLLAIVITMVSQIFLFNTQSIQRNVNVTNVNDNIRHTLNVLEKELRTAKPDTIQNPSQDEISFEMQDGRSMTYTLTSDKEIKKTIDGTTHTVTDKSVLAVETLQFKMDPSSSNREEEPQPVRVVTYLEASVTAKDAKAGSQLPTIPIQTTTVLRNYDKDF